MLICDWIVEVVFLFKQKTAYEMRISDWSSDVCSSDLVERGGAAGIDPHAHRIVAAAEQTHITDAVDARQAIAELGQRIVGDIGAIERLGIGRASCRERVCQFV